MAGNGEIEFLCMHLQSIRRKCNRRWGTNGCQIIFTRIVRNKELNLIVHISFQFATNRPFFGAKRIKLNIVYSVICYKYQISKTIELSHCLSIRNKIKIFLSYNYFVLNLVYGKDECLKFIFIP